MTNIIAIRRERQSQNQKASSLPRKAPWTIKRDRRIRRSAYGVLAVAGTLTALSLDHLATGAIIATGCEPWEGYALAGGVDLGFISLEAAKLVAPIPQVSRYATPAILLTLIVSAVMNAFAFAQGATGWFVPAAIVLGAIIPALVYAQVQAAGVMLKIK